MKTTIYIDKETEELINALKNDNEIYKVISLSQLIKYALIEKCKNENIRILKRKETKKKEEKLKEKFGSIEKVIELAQQDWTITNDDEDQEDDWNTIADEIERWKEKRK